MTQECTAACLTPLLQYLTTFKLFTSAVLKTNKGKRPPLTPSWLRPYRYMSSEESGFCLQAYHTDIFKSAVADIDECTENETNDCDINANCTNTEGSYNCACRIGFRGNGKNCTGMKWIVSKAYQRAVVSIAFSLKGA